VEAASGDRVDVAVSMGDGAVTIAMVGPLSADQFRTRLERSARRLATEVAIRSDRVEPAGPDSLGGLWDHYELRLLGGPAADDVRVRGVSVVGSPTITW
jgi:hypothetical protein